MADHWKCELCGFATHNDTSARRHRNEHWERETDPRHRFQITEEDIVFLRVQGILWSDDDPQ